MITVHILVRDLDCQGTDTFQIAGGEFERIGQNARGRQLIGRCAELFGGSKALFADWLYTKTYAAIPPSRAYDDPAHDPSPYRRSARPINGPPHGLHSTTDRANAQTL
jgi:hypothetical protein